MCQSQSESNGRQPGHVVNLIHFEIGVVGIADGVVLGRPAGDLDHVNTFLEKSVARIVRLINENPSARFNVAELAAKAGCSYSHFFRAFRSHTGSSPYQYVLMIRLERAKKLLPDQSRSLLDIALACGFDSHAHFSFAFRNHFGVSPTQYRQRL